MNSKYKYRIVMIASGKRTVSGPIFASNFVRAQLDSIKPHVREVYPFAIDDTVSPWGVLRNAMELSELINSIRPDIIHAQWGSTTALVGLLASHNKGIPLVISFGGGDLDMVEWGPFVGRLRSKLAVAISRFCSRYARAIIIKSANLYALLPTAVKTKAYILPNGVDMAKFRLMPKIEARRLLSWDADLVIILFSGSSSPSNDVYKNPELAEAAFAILKAERDDVVLEKIRDLPHDMMPVYLNAADALIVTSLKEGSPNVVKEAMACGLPVVTVECGDVSQRLERVYPSRVVNSYDPGLIADALIDVLKAKSRSNGRQELIKQNLDIDSVAKALVKIYAAAIERSSK